MGMKDGIETVQRCKHTVSGTALALTVIAMIVTSKEGLVNVN